MAETASTTDFNLTLERRLAAPPIALEQRGPGRCRVLRAEAERRILQRVGHQHEADQREPIARARARRLHEMRDAHGGAREEDPRPDRAPQRGLGTFRSDVAHVTRR